MKLSELTSTKEITIPEIGMVITVRDLSWPDFMESLEIEDVKERGVFRLTKVIVDWNVTNDKEEKLPVSEEIIRQLPATVIFPLIEVVKGHFGIQKKKLT